jgi:hypothetical protein
VAKPTDAYNIPPPLSFQHPAPIEHRQASDQSSVLVTPQETGRDSAAVAPMDEPLLDPTLHQRASGGSDYFDGVVGIKQDGTAMLDRRSPKPQFAMPFYQPQHQQPMMSGVEMEKTSSSSDGWQQQPQVAPRWWV